MFTVGFTALYLGCGLVLAVVVVTKIEYGKVLRAVAYSGSHSYSIYLWHMSAIAIVSKGHAEKRQGDCVPQLGLVQANKQH